MTSQDAERKYWVALSTHQKIGGRTLFKLFKRFKSLKNVWQASNKDLISAQIDSGQVKAIQEVVTRVDLEKEWQKVVKFDLKVLIFPDSDFPKNLQEVPDPPGILYVKGNLKKQDEIAVAVIGSRKYTEYGERIIQEIVYPLAKSGVTIISGLALGIDALAHATALEAKTRTIGVLGCGLDQIYPVSNIKLADKIIQAGGAIISEFPIGTPALKFNFPIRNRIIAGLSLGTLVVEAAESSGSLITAQCALEYNREVFAVPGNIFKENSFGPNQLIQMGAKLVTQAQDILTELNLTDLNTKSTMIEILPETPEEEKILLLLKKEKIIDQIIRESQLPASIINATLVMLEMKGAIRHLGGGMYVRRGKIKKDKKVDRG